MSRSMAVRRQKWQYPHPQPTPRILHFPRRPRWKQTKGGSGNNLKPNLMKEKRGKLETLFDQERSFCRGDGGDSEERKRERVEEGESGLVAAKEEKWRFQAEMLRAECNLLRMEKEITVKKMEKRKIQMEKMLKSAIQSLLFGRKKIMEGENETLEKEINELLEKLKKLQKQGGAKDSECKNCSNFDKKASLLERRLQKFGGISDEEICIKEIQEMAEATLLIKTSSQGGDGFVSNRTSNVEILRRKMEGLSKGKLLEKMVEEYGTMVPYKEAMLSCSGSCKAIVRRVLEQVRAETEQWSQMQEMLGEVRDEIEELQASRDFWEDRALETGNQIQSLQSAVKEWKQKAVSSEEKANELEEQVSMLHVEIERLRKEKDQRDRARNLLLLTQEAQNETEKRVLVCHKEDNCHAKVDVRRRARTCSHNAGSVVPKRSPLQEIENMNISALPGQQKKTLIDLYKEELRQKKGIFMSKA